MISITYKEYQLHTPNILWRGLQENIVIHFFVNLNACECVDNPILMLNPYGYCHTHTHLAATLICTMLLLPAPRLCFQVQLQKQHQLIVHCELHWSSTMFMSGRLVAKPPCSFENMESLEWSLEVKLNCAQLFVYWN